jgi:hypothetical protein
VREPSEHGERRGAIGIAVVAFFFVGLVVVATYVLMSNQAAVFRIPAPSTPISLPEALATESPAPIPGANPSDDPGPPEGIEGYVPVTLPRRIDLYVGAVSVAPGEDATLHVSTLAPTYSYDVERVDATLRGGTQVVTSARNRLGHDYRSLATVDPQTWVARANWPVTDTVNTTGWQPGVYIVVARDSSRTVGKAIFIVRTPIVRPDRPLFVFSALTYQAYNLWGGTNLYSSGGPRATQVSFERPYIGEEGLGFWEKEDDRTLAWLQTHHLALQFTTDYDLSVAPPDVAPKLLILLRHTEYVALPMRNWVEQHVNAVGDMNLLNFGANSFYWQIRLVPPAAAGAPLDVICYKRVKADPLAAEEPAQATVRWRDPPVNRPEAAVLGAQYVSILGHGAQRFNLTVTAAVPANLLAGTAWHTGGVLRGLLLGEGDLVDPGSGGIAIMDGQAVNRAGTPVTTSVTIRTSAAGARVFNAGTFAWPDGFAPALTDDGVTPASFERFNRNLLAWLGFPTT